MRVLAGFALLLCLLVTPCIHSADWMAMDDAREARVAYWRAREVPVSNLGTSVAQVDQEAASILQSRQAQHPAGEQARIADPRTFDTSPSRPAALSAPAVPASVGAPGPAPGVTWAEHEAATRTRVEAWWAKGIHVSRSCSSPAEADAQAAQLLAVQEADVHATAGTPAPTPIERTPVPTPTLPVKPEPLPKPDLPLPASAIPIPPPVARIYSVYFCSIVTETRVVIWQFQGVYTADDIQYGPAPSGRAADAMPGGTALLPAIFESQDWRVEPRNSPPAASSPTTLDLYRRLILARIILERRKAQQKAMLRIPIP